jgi:hypothetical protein
LSDKPLHFRVEVLAKQAHPSGYQLAFEMELLKVRQAVSSEVELALVCIFGLEEQQT